MIGLASTAVDVARWQFATTSIYHFLFVPHTRSEQQLMDGVRWPTT